MNTAAFTLRSKKTTETYEGRVSIGDMIMFGFERPKNWPEYQHTAHGKVTGFARGGKVVKFEVTKSDGDRYVVGETYTKTFPKAYDAVMMHIKFHGPTKSPSTQKEYNLVCDLINNACEHIDYNAIRMLDQENLYLLEDEDENAVALVELSNGNVIITQ